MLPHISLFCLYIAASNHFLPCSTFIICTLLCVSNKHGGHNNSDNGKKMKNVYIKEWVMEHMHKGSK